MICQSRPRVLFLGCTYAGHHTRFLNLEAHTRDDPRIRPSYRRITGWVDGGSIERLPLLSPGIKGRIRAVAQSAPFASMPRPDIIWASGGGYPFFPYLWSQVGGMHRPLIRDLDWTLEQQEELAPTYYGRRPRRGPPLAAARLMERAAWHSVTLFTPWSNWAADSLRRQGVSDERIQVLPPGIDLDQWRPRPRSRSGERRPLRLLFVGGDFARKGGEALVDVFRARFADRCELDIVTRDEVVPSPGIRVHRAEANSAPLMELYANADLFVLPTRADAFGIATIEAMASGLPVIVGDVGGARDIVDDGVTGWLVGQTPGELAEVMSLAVECRGVLPDMGRRARETAERYFDGKKNDARLVETLVAAACARP